MNEEESLQGGWFSTSDLKLAISLHAAGFAFKPNAEVTRVQKDGRESFTWHFEIKNSAGEDLKRFLKAWEDPIGAAIPRPDNMTCFLLARESMLSRTHIIAESHKAPVQKLLNRGDARLAVTPRLSKEDRQRLAELAS